MKSIGIIGGGAWATALGTVVSQSVDVIKLWARNGLVVNSINTDHINHKYLPNIKLPTNIQASTNLKDVLTSEILLIAIPTQTLRATILELKKLNLSNNIPIIICCKGVEQTSLLLMHEVVQEILPDQQPAVLSGPNFADEVALGLPAATTIACADMKVASELAKRLSTNNFKIYYTDDIVSTALGGAIKNVIAIASGILVGKGLGENAKAALITRGLAEIKRLCVAKGGNTNNLLGLAGVGDLILSCNSNKSRNMSFGINLSQGMSAHDIQQDSPKVVEGISSAKSIYELSKKLNVEMPICQAIYKILYEGDNIEHSIHTLLNRPIRDE